MSRIVVSFGVLAAALVPSALAGAPAHAQVWETEPSLTVGPPSALPGAPISVHGLCPLPGRVVVEIDGRHLGAQPTSPYDDGAWDFLSVELPALEPGPADVVGRCFDLAGRETFSATEPIEVLDPQAYLDELDDARRAWARHEPPAYTYTWFEGGFGGPPFAFRTSVVDGVVTEVVPDIGESLSPEQEEELLAEWHEEMDGEPLPERTIEDHLDRIAGLVADPPAQLAVTYDDWFGYPEEVAIDEIYVFSDDEITTTIWDFVEVTLPHPTEPVTVTGAAARGHAGAGTPGFTG